LVLALVSAGALAPLPAGAQETVGGERAFSFVALGDMPYTVPGDDTRFDRLIGAINRLKPAFSIHVGDIKGGGGPCTDAAFANVLAQFETFEQPLIYAIGDNEWVDCHRHALRPHDPPEIVLPLNRLAKLRALFFAAPGQSLGKTRMPVESQGQVMPAYERFVENQRFVKNGVVFATLHIPGSNNGFETLSLGAATEFFERNRANLAWIASSFRKAQESGASAVVFAFQANLHNIRQVYPGIPPASGFLDTVNAIERGAKAFAKPVLVIQGDNHELEISGLRNAKSELMPNVLRLQVMGSKRVHAVRVVVDPDSTGVFGFFPLIVRENGDF
jgi:hypothetical protein